MGLFLLFRGRFLGSVAVAVGMGGAVGGRVFIQLDLVAEIGHRDDLMPRCAQSLPQAGDVLVHGPGVHFRGLFRPSQVIDNVHDK